MSNAAWTNRLNKPIQYLRALASMMVVWQHALIQIPANMDYIRFPAFGASGVDLFFVISGFIMLVTTTAKPLTPWAFIERRIVRVVPLYWLMTLLMIGIAIAIPGAFRTLQFSLVSVLKSLLFIPYESLSFPGNAWPVLVPGWTLNYEMFFYALFALALLLPKRLRLILLLAALAGLVLTGWIIGSSQSALVWVYTNPLLLEFGAGALVGHWWLNGNLRMPLLISVVLIVVGSCLLVMRDMAPALSFPQVLGAVLLVAGSVHPAISALHSRLLLTLGDASYSIYLTHIFSMGALRMLWPHVAPQTSMVSALAFMTVSLALCATAGVLVYRWVEGPMILRLRLAIE